MIIFFIGKNNFYIAFETGCGLKAAYKTMKATYLQIMEMEQKMF